nr:response regulator [Motiliproteus sediminis]
MIVDDSTAALLLYRELLHDIGAVVTEAHDGAEGLALARADAFDLVITDVDMPRMDGIALCRALRADSRTADLPVVIASTFDTDRDIIKGFESGATAYLSKLELREFLGRTVRDVLWRHHQLRRRTVLVVDDSATIALLIKQTLEQNGFRVVTACDGIAALDLLTRVRPDLILCDILMPGMDGFELCRVLKADPEYATIPLVVMSSSAEKAHMHRMLQYGAAAYLTKPFNLDQLEVTIEKILSDHFTQLLRERERLEQERSGLFSAIESLVKALEARDEYTRGHSEAVARMLADMVSMTGASDDEVALARQAGRLHDIGKIGIADAILFKPGGLTDDEYGEIKKHPELGQRIVESVPSLEAVMPVIVSHHERWDGGGYPEGLRGEQIHPWARLTAVADTFHALASDRPYRQGASYDKAFEIIKAVRGSQLCPDSVELFFRWVDSKGDQPLF